MGSSVGFVPHESSKKPCTSGDQRLTDAQRLKELQRMQVNVDAAIQEAAIQEAALQEIEKIDQSTETMPKRLPITDPESRFGKTKEGGFAPCYTPTATVDIDSGLILDEGVIPQSNESGELMGTIAQVQADYDLENPVPQMLADGLMANGENDGQWRKNRGLRADRCGLVLTGPWHSV